MYREVEIRLHQDKYTWDQDNYLEVSKYVSDSDMELSLKINSYHECSMIIKNEGLSLTRRANRYIFKRGRCVTIRFKDTNYKFKVWSIKNISNDEIEVKLRSQSQEIFQEPCHIRVPNNREMRTVEDVLFLALYETGLHNHFDIETSNGNDYSFGSSASEKAQLSDLTDIAYINMTVGEVLDDITEKSGCIWIEEAMSDDESKSKINVVKMDLDYEIDSGNYVDYSTFKDIISIDPNIDRNTIINYIYFDELDIVVSEPLSMQEYGQKSIRKFKYKETDDINSIISYAKKLLSVSKDPALRAEITVGGLKDFSDLDLFVKVTNRLGLLDNIVGENRKLRITEVTYDFNNVTTEIECGNVARTHYIEMLEDILKAGNNEKEDQQFKICKHDTLRFNVYTDTNNYNGVSDATSSGSDGYWGARYNVDTLWEETEADEVSIYLDSDGVIGGE